MSAPNNSAEKRAQAEFEKGLALHQEGRLAQAQAIYQQVLEWQPEHFDALHLSGVIAAQTGSLMQAVELIGRAIDINPMISATYINRGLALQGLGRLDDALDSYDRALQLKPDSAEAYSNRGNTLQGLRRQDEALDSYDRALRLNPDNAEAYNNRGIALQELRRPEDALDSYDRALQLRPDYAEAYSNRGNALQGLRRLDEALESYNRALQLKPDYAEAHNNRGLALHELRRLDEALDSYDRALRLKPEYAEAHGNLSLCHLLMGDFTRGWKEYEWRRQDPILGVLRRNFTQPLWLGAESLHGKTILLHSEQGLGDTLQFCRYAKIVSGLGARVILEVPRPLIALLTRLAGVAQLIEVGSALPMFDYHCPLLSLPLAFKTNLNSIPSSRAYIRSDSRKVSSWGQRLGNSTRPRIGIAWSGKIEHEKDRKRSIALSSITPYLPANFEYVSLQKDVRDSDKATLEETQTIRHFGVDFTDTAALCELMDVVISVDTSIAHLAGAMGKPVWILLPFVPDWRWLLDRDDSPWYRSARLFRQDRIDDWASALNKVNTALLQQFR